MTIEQSDVRKGEAGGVWVSGTYTGRFQNHALFGYMWEVELGNGKTQWVSGEAPGYYNLGYEETTK